MFPWNSTLTFTIPHRATFIVCKKNLYGKYNNVIQAAIEQPLKHDQVGFLCSFQVFM